MSEMLSEERKRFYKEMVKNFPCAAFVSVDDRNAQTIDVICANQEYYTLTGIAPDAIEFGDHDIRNLDDIATEDKLRVNKEFGEALREERSVAMDASVKRIDGKYMRCRIHARPLEVSENYAIFVVTFHRYDDKHPENIIMRHYVEHDVLTNIFNLKGFCQQTAEVLATYPEKRFIIAVSDIDSFKTINNMFGDEVGDAILKKLGSALKEYFAGLFKRNIPGSYGRIGSDRFAVCLPTELADPDRIIEVSDKILLSMDLNYRIFSHFGLCAVPENTTNVADIVEQAYLACSTVKHNMSVRYAWYDNALRKTLVEEQELIAHAEMALKNHEFVTFFQPVYSSESGRLISAEALVRWNHPEKGMLYPDRFVPIMEKNGFISRLDASVWEEVLSFLHERVKAGKKIVPISVNMSRQDIFNPRLTEELLELLEKYEIDPTYFHIEVTESAYVDDEMQLTETIESLRKRGFIVLMDDFGSGYSSLNVLKDMPVDIMKIDRGLTFDIETSERGKAMLGAIVRLANKLYIPTIAEGVETELQYEYLREIGCDSVQGYYFSKPVSESSFSSLLDEADVPDYASGEAIPGRFVRRELDGRPRHDPVLLVGFADSQDVASARELLRSDCHILTAKGFAQARTILDEETGIEHVLLPRTVFDSLLGTAAEGGTH